MKKCIGTTMFLYYMYKLLSLMELSVDAYLSVQKVENLSNLLRGSVPCEL
jgi:hypothetical protein